MTREEQIIKQVEIYTNDVSNLAEWSDGWEDYDDYKYVKKAFINGAKWADNNPRMFKGQTEKMEEREIAFMDWWLENHKGESPTFADAIAWADKTMVEKACGYLHTHIDKDLVIYHEKSWKSLEQFINEFRKVMEE